MRIEAPQRGPRRDEKERFLIHEEFLLLRLRQYVVGNCDIASRELLLLGAIPLRLSGTGSESTHCLEAEGTVMHLSNESLIVGIVAGWLAGTIVRALSRRWQLASSLSDLASVACVR